MRAFWRVGLIAWGLGLFTILSYHSFRRNDLDYKHPSRYFFWSAIRLDSDPSGNRSIPLKPVSCVDDKDDCVAFDPVYIWVDPGWMERALVVSAFPAFLIEIGILGASNKFGVNQVWIFMVSMPILIFTWFYFVGWSIDRRRARRLKKAPAST